MLRRGRSDRLQDNTDAPAMCLHGSISFKILTAEISTLTLSLIHGYFTHSAVGVLGSIKPFSDLYAARTK